jgi:hypothetical protein
MVIIGHAGPAVFATSKRNLSAVAALSDQFDQHLKSRSHGAQSLAKITFFKIG